MTRVLAIWGRDNRLRISQITEQNMKKSFNKGLLGLIAIPVAVVGIVGSVAFAQTTAQTTTTTPIESAQTATQAADADKEVPDSQEVKGQDEQGADVETADDGNKAVDHGSTKAGDGDGETNDDGPSGN